MLDREDWGCYGCAVAYLIVSAVVMLFLPWYPLLEAAVAVSITFFITGTKWESHYLVGPTERKLCKYLMAAIVLAPAAYCLRGGLSPSAFLYAVSYSALAALATYLPFYGGRAAAGGFNRGTSSRGDH